MRFPSAHMAPKCYGAEDESHFTCPQTLLARDPDSLLFNAQLEQETIDLALSQVIPANDVDRFVVVVGVIGIGDFKRIVFDCEATLFYDQDGATKVRPMIIAFTDDSGELRATFDWKTFTWHPEPVPIQRLEVL